MTNPIRVAVRGASGLLGSRLLAAVGKTHDLRVTAGVVRSDPTLERLIGRLAFGNPAERQALPEQFYLDESDAVLHQLNRKLGGRLTMRPLSELNLAAVSDVVVDAASGAPGKGHPLQAQYQNFAGPIILQDGEYPIGRLIAAPLIAPSQGGNRWRQGGCFLSGIAPILAVFGPELKSLRLHLVMQCRGRESDFLITERVNSFQIADYYIPQMEKELGLLLPNCESTVESVIQIPGMLHYAVALEMTVSSKFTVADVKHQFAHLPRVRLLPDAVTGTYEINLARVLDDRIPPIMVFGGSVTCRPDGTGANIRFKLALYYRTLAVLPNLDAIRVLCQGLDPLEAMRQTDRDMGF